LELVTQILVFYVIIAIGIFVFYDALLLYFLGNIFRNKGKIIVSDKEAEEIPDSPQKQNIDKIACLSKRTAYSLI
jgi:hypothetical protein